MKNLVLKEAEADLREFDRLGLSRREQAERLGVSVKSIEKARAKLKLTKAPAPTVEITPELEAKLRQMEAEGASREEAHRVTGMSQRRLARLYPGLNSLPGGPDRKLRRLSVEDSEADLREFDRLGLPLRDQAQRLGVSVRSVENARRKLGLAKVNNPMVEITPELDALLQRAVEEGWSREEAYRTTGVSHRRLTRLYPGLNMTPEERGFLGGVMRAASR